ncbi:MAG: hypothetical protein PHI31_04125 [Desulfuromonadaceae bacterium]|nr:hypothetical protein [Desulfuromonadaceae bacterium]
MRWMTRGMLLSSLLLLGACASQTGVSEEFDRSVKSYNKMVRWHEIESAGTTYLDPDLQPDFLRQAAALKKRGLSVTDFRILSSTYIPEKKTGEVLTEFDYFILPSNRIKTITYRQIWMYQENSKSWKLKSALPLFE